MMLSIVFILSLCLISVSAFEWPTYINVPSSVEAGVPFNASISVEWHGLASSSWAHAFRIYLASQSPDSPVKHWSTDCLFIQRSGNLLYEQTLCDPTITIDEDYIEFKDTPVTLTIPVDVGPPGKYYEVKGIILNTDGTYYGSSWESPVFEITGANGTWASYQQQGRTLWGDDGIPCTAFSCVKDCAERLKEEAYQECANACPGVDVAFGSSVRGGQATTSLTTPTACPANSKTATATNTAETTSGVRGSMTSSTRSAVAAAATNDANISTSRSMALCFLSLTLAAVYLV